MVDADEWNGTILRRGGEDFGALEFLEDANLVPSLSFHCEIGQSSEIMMLFFLLSY